MMTLLGLLGYGLVTIGAWTLAPWLGLIVGGAELVWLAYVNQPEPDK